MSDKVEEVEGYSSVLKGFTDAQLGEVQRKALALMSQDMDVNKVTQVMIVSRQLYALARLRLQYLLAAEGYQWEDGVEELLIKSMADHANKPFTRTKVFEVMERVARQFMIDEIELEVEQERVDTMQVRALMDKLLSERITTVLGEDYEAGSTVVVVGNEASIKASLEHIEQETIHSWVHLTEADSAFINENDLEIPVRIRLELASIAPSLNKVRDQYLVKFGIQEWSKIGNKRNKFTALMQRGLERTLDGRCDVLILDDVMTSYQPNLVAVNDEFSIYGICEVIKQIRTWAKDHKTVSVLGVTVPPHETGATVATIAELAERYKDIKNVYIVPAPYYNEEKNENE